MLESIDPNWKSILQYVAIAIIIAVVGTVVGGVILSRLQEKTLDLTYYSTNVVPFNGPDKNVAIYTVQISNTGSLPIEHVRGVVEFNNPTETQYQLHIDRAIEYETSSTNNSYEIKIPILNPNDNFHISIYATSLNELPSQPQISVRGDGVTGHIFKLPDIGAMFLIVMVITFLLLATVSAISLGLGNLLTRSGEISAFYEKIDSRDMLSYLCNTHDIPSDVEYYSKLTRKISLWHESDRFYLLSRTSTDSGLIEKRKKVLIDLLKFGIKIQPVTQAIINYNIARIAKIQGNEEEFKIHMDEAKKINSDIIKLREEIDPQYSPRRDGVL